MEQYRFMEVKHSQVVIWAKNTYVDSVKNHNTSDIAFHQDKKKTTLFPIKPINFAEFCSISIIHEKLFYKAKCYK